MHKIFIDTNVLAYAADKNDLKKQRIARQAIDSLKDTTIGVISTQVIQEFYVTAVHKLGIKPLEAKRMILNLENLEIVQIDLDQIKEAIDCSILNQLSFWDALIISAAQEARCDVLWSEDLSDKRMFKSLKVENIFKK